ncbi:MAG: hypothetical protein QNJ40_05465 [Xanthomonadales bacterium]|nr:hypothetical protein [Xanthomonadales bacterium]
MPHLPGNQFRTGTRPSVSRTTPLIVKLIGVPLLLIGAALVWPTLTGSVTDGDGNAAPWWLKTAILVMGTPPLLFGIYCIFGRQGVVLDRARDRLEAWWGLGVPMWRKRHKLGRGRKISLGIERTSSGEGVGERTRRSFRVRLTGRGGPVIDKFSNALAARRFAERCARTLQLPMLNRLVEPPDLRQIEELDKPVAARIREHGIPPEPLPPPGTRLSLTRGLHWDEMLLDRPRFIPHWPGLALILGLLAVMFWYTVPVVLDSATPVVYRLAAGTVPVATLVALSFDFVVKTRVTVSGDDLRIRKFLGPLGWGRRFPLAEIEELFFDGVLVWVVSDREKFSIGGGHTEADAAATDALLRVWVARRFKL